MRNTEFSPIILSGCDKSLRSINEHNGIHCLDQQQSVEESIAAVDIPAYFKKLRASGVDQWNAVKIAIDCAERVNDEKVPAVERRMTTEALQAAVSVLPKRLVPVGITQDIFRRR